MSDTLYATDASEEKGAFVSTCIGSRLSRALWRTASKKGGYSRLFSKEEALLARFHDPEAFHFRASSARVSDPEKPLAFFDDFLILRFVAAPDESPGHASRRAV